MDIVDKIHDLWLERGHSNYGEEAVSQLEHALQTADLALRAGSTDELIAAALLHDVGHILHNLADDAPDHGVDDRHEEIGNNWLVRHFSAAVSEPVRLHVAAKRYLCTVDPAYMKNLSPPSILSLKLQGGLMNADELSEFESLEYFEDSVRLRKWDDEAKIDGLNTPDLDTFMAYVRTAYDRARETEAN